MENQNKRNKGMMSIAPCGKSTSNISQSNEKRSSARWDDFSSVKFIELCEDEIGKDNRPNSHFNINGWKNIVKRFNEMTGKNYDYKQLRIHWDVMKKDWILFKKLMNKERGVDWNAVKNSLDALDEWWESKLKENGDYGKFRNKNLTLIWFRYDRLFSDIAATRKEQGHQPKY
ncbi:hypothetical protein BUALT_Bualt05G0089500 [Buddleja alternifolia]|uniref:Myb/SANT-like domain-containing protein n=1 Tax=Buddleja alternifolia TaxID=168488 RepID=A0AAV6XTL7_9LAMI|nr:hypothetical protein BUALT_Bualt05G0089500 [Buddleja alternifolia]